MEINVSLETYKALTLLLRDEKDTHDKVISRLLASEKAAPSEEAPKPEMAQWFEFGIEMPIGTELRRKYKNQQYVATVQANGLEVNGKIYPSLSAAGTAITGYNLNGWDFWYHLDSASGRWVSIGSLRTENHL